jgi:hypothetical protein
MNFRGIFLFHSFNFLIPASFFAHYLKEWITEIGFNLLTRLSMVKNV